MKKIIPYKIMLHHIYLLQLELYEIRRYLKLILRTKGIPANVPRKKIIWTPKLIAISVVALIFLIVTGLFISQLVSVNHTFLWFSIAFFVIIHVLYYFYFFFLTIAVLLFTPLDSYLKHDRISKARRKIRTFPNLKIIGIAGSYGKTTMKEVVATILSAKYHVLKTPENINTPLGIAELILKKLDSSYDVFVVEMGEFYKGDIATLCQLAPPEIGIITGINEAHLERLQTLSNAASTIFELADNLKPNGILYLNRDDKNIVSYKSHHAGGKNTVEYSKKDASYDSKLLAPYANGTISAASQIAKELGLTEEQIKKGIAAISPIKHRLEPIQGNQGILVIDDSYNGNPEGVREAIEVLASYKKRRKIYITPGLVEMGEKSHIIHHDIGRELSNVADIVILIKNSVTPYIAKGLEENGFKKENIIWFNKAEEAHTGLKDIVKPDDVVMFQNDWPDNYV